MNCLIVIALFIASALALPNVQQKEARKHHPVPCKDCGSWRPGHPGNPDHHSGHHPHHYDCHDPCQDCAEPRVSTKTFSPVTVQEVSDRTILVCSDESYYDRIEYDACYEWNTTCNGVIVGSANNVKGIYTGIKVDRHTGKETQEVLNARNIGWISTSNNGHTF